jgi:hypothetical protein
VEAGQFLEEVQDAVAAERHDACLLNAIHSAISAADVVTVVLAGRRSADPDHQRAADLLEEMGASTPASKERVRQLRTLLSRRRRAQSSLPVPARRPRSSLDRLAYVRPVPAAWRRVVLLARRDVHAAAR